MNSLMWLPVCLAVMMLPSTIGLWLFAEAIMAKETEERNKLNGWE